MATPPSAVEINTQIFYQSTQPAVGARVVAELQSASQNSDGYIVPKVSEFIVDENGDVTLTLWPNNDGNTGTFYKIVAYDSKLTHLLEVFAIIPESNTPLRLEDIALPITTLDLANASGSVPSCRQILTSLGISGGGDFSQNRTHVLDFTTIPTEELNPDFSDTLAIHTSEGIKYVKLQNLPGVGFTLSEEFLAVTGQTEFVTSANIVTPEQVEVYIDGKRQPPTRFTVDEDTNTITLSEALEGDTLTSSAELVEIVIKQTADAVFSIDASQVSYNGVSNVETALDTLFATAGITPWNVVTSSQNLIGGERIFLDSSGGSFILTLPPTPSIGATVEFIDINFPGSSILTNPVTVDRNGELIMGLADDLILDTENVSISLIYAGPSKGWRFSE